MGAIRAAALYEDSDSLRSIAWIRFAQFYCVSVKPPAAKPCAIFPTFAKENNPREKRECFSRVSPSGCSLLLSSGFGLRLEGETYLCKDRIKSFTSADGTRFRWSKHKTAWYFAAVPSSNRSGHCYSFEEIEAIHGREVVSERVRQSKLAA